MVFLDQMDRPKRVTDEGDIPLLYFWRKGITDQFGTIVFIGVPKDFANVNVGGGERYHHFARISFSNS